MKFLVTALITLLNLNASYGQLSKYNEQLINFKSYSTKNGFPNPYVRKILQDKLGFIWLATSAGIFTFDGSTFSRPANDNAAAEEPFIDVFDIVEDTANNTIWATDNMLGIISININTRKCQTIDLRSNFSPKPAALYSHKLQLNKDKLWIFIEGGILIYSPANKTCKKIYIPPALNALHSLCAYAVRTASGNIVAFYTNGHCFVFNREGNLITRPSITHFKESERLAFAYYNKNKLIALLANNIISFFKVQETNLQLVNSFSVAGKMITTIEFDKEGNLVIAGLRKLLIVHNDASITTLKNAKDYFGYPNEFLTHALFIDDNDDLWMGTSNGLYVAKKTPAPFVVYYSDQNNIKLNHLSHLFLLNDSLIFSAGSEGVFKTNLINRRNDLYPSDAIEQMILEPYKQTYFLSSKTGNVLLNSPEKNLSYSKIASKYPDLSFLQNHQINGCEWMQDSTIAVFSGEDQTGIYLFYKKAKKLKTLNRSTQPALTNTNINQLLKINDSTLAILTDVDVMIWNAANNTINTIDFSAFPGKPYAFLCGLKMNEDLLLGCYGTGLYLLDSKFRFKKRISTKEGLCDNGIYKIIAEDTAAPFVWVTTNNGLARLNVATWFIKNYYEEDGLHSNQFEERSGLSHKGQVYVGGVNGFTRILPQNLSHDEHIANTYFTSYQIRSTQAVTSAFYTGLNHLEVQQNAIQITVSYCTLNYTGSPEYTYEYKVSELGNQWISNNKNTSIVLTGLNPGKYHLYLRTQNGDGFIAKDQKLLMINILPKWYQTLWFKFSLILAGISIFYAAYRYRLHQLYREDVIRTRIAADLHDDIGSTLTSVRVFTELGIAKKSTEYLPQVKLGLQEATSNLRDVIWVLDNTKNDAAQLAERIKHFAQPITNASQIHFSCIEEDGLQAVALSIEERRNLYLIAKEFITNSVKYAQCNQISITIEKYKKKLRIRMLDNGIGFDMATVNRGNGINNILRRAADAGYQAVYTTGKTGGTKMDISPAS